MPAQMLDEAMVIGGEQIYRMTLPAADRLYLTEVQAEVEGDAFFPEFDTRSGSRSVSSCQKLPIPIRIDLLFLRE